MIQISEPVLFSTQDVTASWKVLPGWLPVPGLGTLPVNAFLLKGSEPMLVDTGVGALGEQLIDRLCAEIDPEDLRWIWLSHTDADHLGNLDQVLELAPNATVVTNFLAAGKMGMMGVGDPERMRLLEPDEVLEVGHRRLHQVKPPYYDAPETMGFFDETDRVLFAADAFGALLPGCVETIGELPAATVRDGLVSWSSVDAPWLAKIDRAELGGMLRSLEALDPSHVLSGHLPVADDLRTLTAILDETYGRGTSGDLSSETASRVRDLLA